MNPFGIHWFRRDLRIAGNPSLKWNIERSKGRTLGVFFFDSKFLARPDFSPNRFAFFLQTLKSLKIEMKELGGDLLVLNHGPAQGFDFLLSKLKNKAPAWITFNRDYEPFARERDEKIQRQLEQSDIKVHSERDHLLIEPLEVQKENSISSFYQVYTPFSKKWFSLLSDEVHRGRISDQQEALSYLEKKRQGKQSDALFRMTWKTLFPSEIFPDSLEEYIKDNSASIRISLPSAGSLAAYNAARDFRSKLDSYLEKRDYPALPGTSKLSIYFKNGSITPALVFSMMKLMDVNLGQKNGKTQFLKELIWREFFYHILFHRPHVEHEAFLPRYRTIKWSNREDWFEAWKAGRTGYPIVDAAMRELKSTGWMHNRSRMITASFLTKDLLIDWRWGERYFMNELLDGDLAPNNGGWQWAASTGCDPQPYFRIFNPVLQSKRYDPHGDYIKAYIPELRHKSGSEIHLPLKDYIQPIVDHSTQKKRTLVLYKQYK